MKNEPVLTASAIVGAIMAVVTFAVAMGYISWDASQVGAFEAMIVALVALLLPIVVAFWPRSQVDGPVTAAAKDSQIEQLQGRR